MSLQQALDDCLIDFDRRVLVTDLLEKYKLTYKEAHEALEAHIEKQERTTANKYEKCFLVHGMKANADENADKTELYTIVQGDDKLKEWLQKLENSQSQLYSVEIAGGSKSAAPIFKPMQQVQVKLAKLEQRAGSAVKPVANGEQKADTPKSSSVKVESTKSASVKLESTKAKSPSNKSSPTEQQKKSSPTEQKGKGKAATAAAATKKGSINSFFSAAPAAKAQPQPKAAATKTATKSMENFFKKQPTSSTDSKKSPTESVKKELKAANTSVQLFEAESEASSDEEEKLDKLRRKVLGSGDESDDEKDAKPSTSSKRRRISDSEDEEQPQKKSTEPQSKEKQPKEKEDEAMDVEAATNETFLDDDGFVITVKPKKQMQAAKKKTSPTAVATAATTKKKSPPAAAAATASKGAKETPKTKQSNISSFFSKK